MTKRLPPIMLLLGLIATPALADPPAQIAHFGAAVASINLPKSGGRSVTFWVSVTDKTGASIAQFDALGPIGTKPAALQPRASFQFYAYLCADFSEAHQHACKWVHMTPSSVTPTSLTPNGGPTRMSGTYVVTATVDASEVGDDDLAKPAIAHPFIAIANVSVLHPNGTNGMTVELLSTAQTVVTVPANPQ